MSGKLEHTRDGGYEASAEQMAIQQAAAAVANEAYSPEAIAAEAVRRQQALAEEAAVWRREGREQCIRENRPIEAQYLEPESWENEGGALGPAPAEIDFSDPERRPSNAPRVVDEITTEAEYQEWAKGPAPKRSRLADLLAEVVEDEQEEDVEEEPVPEDVMGGAHLVRWILVPADESDGWTLGLSTESHLDGEPDAVYLEVTQAMMKKWRNAPTAAKDLERFAAGLMEKVADALAEDLTDHLIEALERITRGELREKQHLDPPTETSVGDDEVEPFDSLDEYVEMRDAYSQTLSREEFAAFLDTNQEYEDEIERRNA